LRFFVGFSQSSTIYFAHNLTGSKTFLHGNTTSNFFGFIYFFITTKRFTRWGKVIKVAKIKAS